MVRIDSSYFIYGSQNLFGVDHKSFLVGFKISTFCFLFFVLVVCLCILQFYEHLDWTWILACVAIEYIFSNH
jgi:hypothetical protein